MEKIDVRTTRKIEVLDITDAVRQILEKRTASDSKHLPTDGAILVFCPHTTCGLMLNEFEPDLAADFQAVVKEYYAKKWRHDAHDGNAAAHLASALFGHSAMVPLQSGRLQLGTWQRILLLEADGPRERQMWVTTL